MHQLPVASESEANLASAFTEQIRQLGEIEKKIAVLIFSRSIARDRMFTKGRKCGRAVRSAPGPEPRDGQAAVICRSRHPADSKCRSIT